MAAHKKLPLLHQLTPDIAILPECAAPDVIVSKCPGFTFTDAQWLERSRHKGLGVFSFGDFYFTRSPSFDPRFEVTGGRVSTGNWSLFMSRQYMKEHGGDIRIQDLIGDDKANIVWVQDYAVQVGQGPIELRKYENLGRSDMALILQRKIWVRELQALADGKPLTPWARTERLAELRSYSHVPEASQKHS